MGVFRLFRVLSGDSCRDRGLRARQREGGAQDRGREGRFVTIVAGIVERAIMTGKKGEWVGLLKEGRERE